MIQFNNFYETDIKIINDALLFTRAQIYNHYEKLAAKVDQQFQKTIWDEYDRVSASLNNALAFFKENESRPFIPMKEDHFSSLMDIVASALAFYRKHLEEIQRITDVSGYIELIKSVDNILSLGGPQKAKKEIFQKYYPIETQKNNEHLRKKPEFFISYQDKDREKACEMKRLLISNSELDENDVFVAHRDIPLAKKWRDDIIYHLENCTHLIAICTENYKCSAWGNQEVGYAMARKDVNIIPLFWEGTERKHFGFIEGFQALPDYVNEKNLEKAVNEILERVGLRK